MRKKSLQNIGPMFGDGMTCEHSRPNQSVIGDAILSAEDSRVKTSARVTIVAKDSLGPDQDSGENLRGCFAFYDPNTQSLKTFQRLLFGGLELFCAILPRSGSMQNGRLCQRRRLAHRKEEKDFSLWPAPQASDAMRMKFSLQAHQKHQARNKRLGFGCGPARLNLVAHCMVEFGGVPTAEFVEWLMGFPMCWTDTVASATPSSPKSPNGSASES